MQPLGEFESRILAELEEAGQENLPTLINTILRPTGSTNEITTFRQALENLVGLNLAMVTTERDPSGKLRDVPPQDSLKILTAIGEHLTFNEDLGRWTGGPRPWPEVITNPTGKAKGRELLMERGWRWWRENKQT